MSARILNHRCNWGYWVGTVSLFVEAALIVLSLTMLLSYLAQRAQPWPR